MRRAILYAAMAATCALTAVLDIVIARTTTIEPFSLSVWVVVPVGAMLCGMAACSGTIAVSYLLHVRPTKVDALAMILMGLACMALILFLNYWTYVLPDGRRAHDLIDFWRFTDVTTRTAHMRFGRALQTDVGEVGSFGYYQLGFEVLAFLFGGLATYATIIQLPACDSCPSYLRKVRETSNGDLPLDQADRLLALMNGGLEDVQNVVAWKPPPHAFGKKDQRARLTYRLYECPKCKLEAVVAKAQVFNGKEWKDAPKASVRRNLAAGTTLWTAFK